MGWVDNLLAFNAHYPAIALFINTASAVMGVFLIIVTGMKVYQYHGPGASPQGGNLGMLNIAVLLCIASMMIIYSYTMFIVANTVFGNGSAFTITDYASTQSLLVGNSENTTVLLKDFALSTSKLLGTFVGLWGLFNIWTGSLPNGKPEMVVAGFVRMFMSVIMAYPKVFFDMFGMGSVFFN
ncbi:MAG: hypothetical protein ACJAS1_002472 [Oleiphilaceae bacterium]|jgi:hypothetical protein